jgi:hypothetical protein
MQQRRKYQSNATCISDAGKSNARAISAGVQQSVQAPHKQGPPQHPTPQVLLQHVQICRNRVVQQMHAETLYGMMVLWWVIKCVWLTRDDDAHALSVVLGPPGSAKHLHDVQWAQLLPVALGRVVHLGALDDDCVGGQVDPPC